MTLANSRTTGTGAEHRPAGIVTRTAAAGADLAMVIVISSVIYLAVAGVRLLWSPSTFTWPEPGFAMALWFQGTIAVIYLTVGWAISGRTYGKSLLGLRVVTRRGDTLGWGRAFLRAWFCVVFPLGLVWVIFSQRRRSVQDVVLRTIVIYDWHQAPAPAP